MTNNMSLLVRSQRYSEVRRLADSQFESKLWCLIYERSRAPVRRLVRIQVQWLLLDHI